MHIHIGYRKTGTSFLQKNVFSCNNALNYIAKTKENYPDWLIKWHYSDDLLFEQVHESIKEAIKKQTVNDKINLISSEAFTTIGNLFQQAARIHRIFPDAKIVCTLRDPIDLIISFYKFNVLVSGFTDKLENLIDWNRTPLVVYKRKPVYLADYFYDEVIGLYCRLFGEENVCVLKFEDMTTDPDTFFSKLSGFMQGVDFDLPAIRRSLSEKINPSPDESEISMLRVKNMYHKIKKEFPFSRVHEKDIVPDDNEILGSMTAGRIIESLKDRCFGYY